MKANPAAAAPSTSRIVLNHCSKAILKALLYYDIFQYPLREQEIIANLSVAANRSIRPELEYLLAHRFINQYQGFYFIGHNKEVVSRRIRGNELAEKYLKVVTRHVRWLSWLPFIQCICLSGSLSKQYMDEKSDVDYFIITEPNRLWIIRAVLSLVYKVLCLFKMGHYLCPNYLITPNSLSITDRNIYTAIETATLLPLYNLAVYQQFIKANQWVTGYLPNFIADATIPAPSNRNKTEISSVGSRFLNHLNHQLFKLYQDHYQDKYKQVIGVQLVKEDVHCHKDVCKMHLSGHRNRILDRYAENIQQFEKYYQVTLLD